MTTREKLKRIETLKRLNDMRWSNKYMATFDKEKALRDMLEQDAQD